MSEEPQIWLGDSQRLGHKRLRPCKIGFESVHPVEFEVKNERENFNLLDHGWAEEILNLGKMSQLNNWLLKNGSDTGLIVGLAG